MAVRAVDLEAYFGEMLYVVGPSGSGKTTLLSILSGILRPDEGSVTVDGPGHLATEQRLARGVPPEHRRVRVSGLPPVPAPHDRRKRRHAADPQARPWADSIAAALRYLEIVGLKNRAELPPIKLSGGEQQRVAIARAIVSRADMLILDEPTASLDGETGRKIVEFVAGNVLDRRARIVMVTHDSRIFEFADRILTMEDGRITGTAEAA